MPLNEIHRYLGLCFRTAGLVSQATLSQRRTVAGRIRLLRKTRRLIATGETLRACFGDDIWPNGSAYMGGARPGEDRPGGRGPRGDWPLWHAPELILSHPDDLGETLPLARLSPVDWHRQPTSLALLHREALFGGWIYPGWRYVVCSPIDHPGMIAIGYDTMKPVKDARVHAHWWARCPMAAPAPIAQRVARKPGRPSGGRVRSVSPAPPTSQFP
ncbi:hypothetical protein P7L74_09645 [Tistrella mobilis]|uniref:hypothetical protein n=1 Tax=Tistrella mobilis TaxID=171437 RepID=UPI003558DAF9